MRAKTLLFTFYLDGVEISPKKEMTYWEERFQYNKIRLYFPFITDVTRRVNIDYVN